MLDFIFAEVILKLSNMAFKSLSKRHAVNIKYLLNSSVEEQFTKCINIATKAFLDRAVKFKNFRQEDLDFFSEYLKGNKIGEEISKLLDPGFEVFDIDLLTSYFEEFASAKSFSNYESKIIRKGWDDFLKAFSFSSRSTPDLREFLRASYEAGSFRAISNINDAIENIEDTLSAVNQEESRLKHLITVFSEDLHQYRDWANQFSYNN